MKLPISLLFIFLLFKIPLSAQSKKFEWGISLAPSVERRYNPADTKNELNFRGKLSYNFGVKARYFVSDRVSINSGLMIYNKGTTYSVPYGSNPIILSQNIWYLSIPLNLQAHFYLPNEHVFSPIAGFTFGRKVFQYFHQVGPTNKNFYTIVSDGSSTYHLGLALGLSYAFQLKGMKIEIAPSYIRQLNDGWKYTPESAPNIRYDSYILEFTCYGLFKKGILR